MIRTVTPGRVVGLRLLSLPEPQPATVIREVIHEGVDKVLVRLNALPVHVIAPRKNLYPVK